MTHDRNKSFIESVSSGINGTITSAKLKEDREAAGECKGLATFLESLSKEEFKHFYETIKNSFNHLGVYTFLMCLLRRGSACGFSLIRDYKNYRTGELLSILCKSLLRAKTIYRCENFSGHRIVQDTKDLANRLKQIISEIDTNYREEEDNDGEEKKVDSAQKEQEQEKVIPAQNEQENQQEGALKDI